MTPLRNKIHIRPSTAEEKFSNGIIIPESIKREKIICDVLAVGNKVTITDAGDKVYIDPSIGIDLGDGTSIISEHEVRAIIPFPRTVTGL